MNCLNKFMIVILKSKLRLFQLNLDNLSFFFNFKTAT